MFIEKNSLDDIVTDLLQQIRNHGVEQHNKKGKNKEILGVYIKLTNPLNRISTSFAKSIFVSPIGEFLWYMSGSDQLSFIEYYIPNYPEFSNNKKTLNGAYGARLFNKENILADQVRNVIKLLKEKRNTRQAVIQIFDKNDLLIPGNLDIPCTCTLQFFIRENKLSLFVTMRSNDVYVGLPHDIFCFTMLQEIISKELGTELGDYNHFITSCHYYMKDDKKVNRYLSEGLQTSKTQMKPMPNDTDLKMIEMILKYEMKIRTEENFDIDSLQIDYYWKDLLYILKIFSLSKKIKNKGDLKNEIKKLLPRLDNENYKIYLADKYDL